MKKNYIVLLSLFLITSLTYSQRLSESFESSTPPAIDWRLEYANATPASGNIMTHSTDQAYAGSRSFRFSSFSSGSPYDQYLISPLLDVTAADSVTFYYRKSSTFGTEPFAVGVSSTDSALASFTYGTTVTNATTTGWQKHVEVVPSGTKYISIRYTANYEYYLYIDSLEGPKVFVPSCPKLNTVNISTPSADSAIMSWTYSGTPLGYGYEYGPTGFTLGTGTQGLTSASSDTIAGLTANTTYDVYFRVLCAIGDTSVISGPFTFTTPCLSVSTFPYTENFDGTLTAGVWDCWKVINNDGGPTWSQSSTYITARSGSWTAHGMGNNDDYLITPQFTIGADPIRLRFWDIVESATRNNTYTVRVSTTGTAIADFTDSITTIDCSNTSWVEHIVALSAYTNQKIYVAFHQTYSTSSSWGFGIDDFKAEKIPNCPEPSNTSLGAHAITATTASINWTEAGTATSWRVEIGAPGFTLGTGTSTIESNDTVPLTGLSPFTTYEFYVTAICTPTDSSPWAGPYSFTTLCNDTNLGPWMDDVEGHPSTNTITGIANCWSGTKTGSSFEWEITNSGTTGSSFTGALSANSGTNFFYTEASGAGTSDTTTLISPSIDLTSLTTPFLEFYYHMFGNQIGSVSVEVFDGTTWSNELTITGAQQATQASPWNQQFVDLSSYSGIIQLRFVAVSNGSYEGDICLDDIAVIESPTCFTPSMAMANGTINDSTTASWTQQFGTPTKYYIEYGATGFTPGAGTLDSTTTTTKGLGGLTASTTYDYYVRAYCGVGDTTAWVGPITFTTQCNPDVPTYSQDFATYTPTCWEEANGFLTTSSNVVSGNSDWKADGFANVGSTGAVSMNIWSTGKNDWIISNPIDLGDGSVPYQVEFDAALTDYASTSSDAMGSDDTLAFVISTDFGQTWTSANILRNYVSGDEPTNAGSREFIDLSAYTGVVKFGFYAASTVSNADYDVHIDNFLVTNLCVPSTISYTDTACGTYVSPSGKIWNMPGTYNDTLQKVRGCDSILVITLVVNNTTATVSPTVCDSMVAPSGKTFYTTGMYMDTISNSIGCDSIITINLTVNNAISVTNTVTACDSYTLPDGYVTPISGTFKDTVPTSLGCDSIITSIVTINYTTSSSISVAACGTYTSPSGKVWSTSGSRFDTIPNASGCDSLMTISLSISPVTSETRTISSCFSYTVPETGSVYTTSGTYTDVTTNTYGCNHTITTVLTINSANAGTVSVSGITLTSSVTGVSYKWVDCNNDYSYLLGETGQSFTPFRNGNYAVEVETTDGCKDTSACTMIMSVSLDEYEVSASDISIFPNPANDIVTIDIAKLNADENVTVKLFDAVGKLVYSKEISSLNSKVTFDVSSLEAGIYSVSVSNEFFVTTKKVTVIN